MTCNLCDKPVEAKGLCKSHYRESRKRIVAEEKRQQRAAMTGDDDDEPRRGRGYTTDQLGNIPLARPMTDEERELMSRLLTRRGALDLADMLGVAA